MRPPKSGDHVDAIVERVEHHGIILQIEGVLGKRGRGYMSNRDLGNAGNSDRKKTFGLGAKIRVKVTGTDRDGGLRCSIRALESEEERKAVKAYRKEASQQGFGTFADLLKAKLGE